MEFRLESPWQFHEQKFGIGISMDRSLGPKNNFISILEEAFDPSDGDDSYQRQYVISVANKVEDCYYIERVRVNQIINFHFVVSTLDKKAIIIYFKYLSLHGAAGKFGHCYINTRVISRPMGCNSLQISIKFGFFRNGGF